jgi:hypothetical protein
MSLFIELNLERHDKHNEAQTIRKFQTLSEKGAGLHRRFGRRCSAWRRLCICLYRSLAGGGGFM